MGVFFPVFMAALAAGVPEIALAQRAYAAVGRIAEVGRLGGAWPIYEYAP